MGDEDVLAIDGAMVVQPGDCTENHSAVCFKEIRFTVCKLHLNKLF